MEKLETLEARRDEILDKINSHNHDVALLREELDNVQYRIGIQRLLRERGDLLKDEKVKDGIEWISIAQMIEQLEKKWEAVSRPSPCCEEEVEKLREENEGLKAQLEAAMAELRQIQIGGRKMDELEKLRKENEELKKKVKELEVTVNEWKTAKWFEMAQSVQSFRMNPYRNF